MTAVSISVGRGVALTKATDFTVGTSAPGTGDIELRYNLLDGNGGTLTRMDIVLACKGLIRALEQGSLIVTSPML